MLEIENERIIGEDEPVSGVIMTREEFEKFWGEFREAKRRVCEAENLSHAAEAKLDAVQKDKKAKEAVYAGLQERVVANNEIRERLEKEIEKRKRLKDALLKQKQED